MTPVPTINHMNVFCFVFFVFFVFLIQVMACAVRQHAITWANVDRDLCRPMASLGHNELISNNFHLSKQTLLQIWILSEMDSKVKLCRRDKDSKGPIVIMD